ncbi:MAG: hypothetical protein ACD_46C00144G0001 [uncultured bacterium]|nr:MAG: hypothetical protein ACD_46C00144G0001 [uncultured bacterium]
MQITERDVEILKFINEFGFCEIKQIEKQFCIKKSRGYQIMKRLVIANLVTHQMIFHGAHGIFYLTKEGAQYTDLPQIKNIPKDNYEHQLAIIEIYFKLKEQYPEAEWIGERRIKREKYMKGLGKAGHIADAMLVFPDSTEIAIEVELTMKSKKRLTDIFKNYVSCFDIKEVWYFCAPEIIGRVSKLAEKMPFIKIHSLR